VSGGDVDEPLAFIAVTVKVSVRVMRVVATGPV
jgi:hypothetical protein